MYLFYDDIAIGIDSFNSKPHGPISMYSTGTLPDALLLTLSNARQALPPLC